MKIFVRVEEEKDFRRVEEITREAFSYPGRIEQGGIGCPYEHWMVHELRKRDGIRELCPAGISEKGNRIRPGQSNDRSGRPDGFRRHTLFWPPGILSEVWI